MAERKLPPTGYWVFSCNPKKWPVDRFFEQQRDFDTWDVSRHAKHEFAPGQLALLRVGVDGRSNADRLGRPKMAPGVYAVCEVQSRWRPRPPDDDPLGHAHPPGWPMVDVQYLRKFVANPLPIATIEAKLPNASRHLRRGLETSTFPIPQFDFFEVLRLLNVDRDSLPGSSPIEPSTLAELVAIESKFKDSTPAVREQISKRIERGRVGELVKRANNYRCQICEQLNLDPVCFRKTDGNPYVEAHHVWFVSKLLPGSLSASNIISVCPNHHRQIHYGGVAEPVVTDKHFQFQWADKQIGIKRVTQAMLDSTSK